LGLGFEGELRRGLGGSSTVAVWDWPQLASGPPQAPGVVFYVGINDQIYTWAYASGWSNSKLGKGEKVAPVSGLAADEAPNGYLSVYFAGANGQMYNWLYTSYWANAAINSSGSARKGSGALCSELMELAPDAELVRAFGEQHPDAFAALKETRIA
jgi:hypothetical protein